MVIISIFIVIAIAAIAQKVVVGGGETSRWKHRAANKLELGKDLEAIAHLD